MEGKERPTRRRRLGHAPSRRTAILLGVLVTFLWASSVVLIRLGLEDETLDPVSFAGVRFFLAAIMLVPLAWTHLRRARITQGGVRSLSRLLLYGWLMFGIGQIVIHVALGQVSAATMGLMIGLTPVATTLIVLRGEHERPTREQVAGVAVLTLGVIVYFSVGRSELDSTAGLLLAAFVPVGVGVASVIGRGLAVEVDRYGGPLGMTAIAMLIGGTFALLVSLLVQGLPGFSLEAWAFILWLAAINTAFTYTLWTQVMRTLKAVEASVLGDLTVLMTAFLGWLVLGETLGAFEMAGLVLTVLGVAIVQLAPLFRRDPLGSHP